jgi:hypothetical protein
MHSFVFLIKIGTISENCASFICILLNISLNLLVVSVSLKDAMAQVPFENSNYIMNENMGGSLNELSYEKYNHI